MSAIYVKELALRTLVFWGRVGRVRSSSEQAFQFSQESFKQESPRERTHPTLRLMTVMGAPSLELDHMPGRQHLKCRIRELLLVNQPYSNACTLTHSMGNKRESQMCTCLQGYNIMASLRHGGVALMIEM